MERAEGIIQSSLCDNGAVWAGVIPRLSPVGVGAAVKLQVDVLFPGIRRDIQTVARGSGNPGPDMDEVRAAVPLLVADFAAGPLHDRCVVGGTALCVQESCVATFRMR